MPKNRRMVKIYYKMLQRINIMNDNSKNIKDVQSFVREHRRY